jgi:hypothetical protein
MVVFLPHEANYANLLPSIQVILEGEESSSTKKEESNHDYHADET